MREARDSQRAAALATTIDRLCEASRAHAGSPYPPIAAWPASLDQAQWFTSPELVSLFGTAVWNRLDEIQRRRLSFWEAVNFYSLNIHGEKPLVEGLAHRLYRRVGDVIDPYLHHFLDEENKHMVYFGEFCTRYAGRIYPDRKVPFPREYAPGEEELLFFAKVLIFEEIVDVYNVQMSLDPRVHPVARQINSLHHLDEARHLVFGRRLVPELFARYAPSWPESTVRGVRAYLASYLLATWKEYYNPDVYRDAAIPGDPYELAEQAFDDPVCRRHRARVSQRCVDYLLETGLLEEAPTL
jgi:para-aminobenzoate N-oxygenase AurF